MKISSTLSASLRQVFTGSKRAKTARILLLVLMVFAASAVLLSFTFFSEAPSYSISEIQKAQPVAAILSDFEDEEVSDSSLLAAIRKNNIRFEYHVLAQAIVESHNYKSRVFRETNNLFGMRYPGKRTTTACGIYLSKTRKVILGDKTKVKKYLRQFNFSVYSSWYNAVKDYKLWQQSVYKTDEDYATFLKRVYATAPAYNIVIEALASELRRKFQPRSDSAVVVVKTDSASGE